MIRLRRGTSRQHADAGLPAAAPASRPSLSGDLADAMTGRAAGAPGRWSGWPGRTSWSSRPVRPGRVPLPPHAARGAGRRAAPGAARPRCPRCWAGRPAGTRHGARPSRRCAAAAQAGDWDFGAQRAGPGRRRPAVPGRSGRAGGRAGRVPAGVPGGRRPGGGGAGRGPAVAGRRGRAPRRTWTARGARWTGWTPTRTGVVAPWLTALTVMQGASQADAGPGWLAIHGHGPSTRRKRRPRCRSTGRPGCCGSRSAARGCAAGRSRRPAHALARASAQLAAGQPARAAGPRARLAGAGRGPLRRPGRRRPR